MVEKVTEKEHSNQQSEGLDAAKKDPAVQAIIDQLKKNMTQGKGGASSEALVENGKDIAELPEVKNETESKQR